MLFLDIMTLLMISISSMNASFLIGTLIMILLSVDNTKLGFVRAVMKWISVFRSSKN